MAEVLQASLLSLPEKVEGVEFSSAYRASVHYARVGGDFFDIFEIEDGLVGILIGDVSGKGLDAAVVTSVVRNTVRASAAEPGRKPCEVVRLANKVILRATDAATFVTLFFAVIDTRSGDFSYCNAGHTTGAIVRSTGEVAGLGANSPVAGAFPEFVFSSHKGTLDFDDVLFLYTDGIIEARRDRELYGEERLFTLLGSIPEVSPTGCVESAMAAVVAFTQGVISDDVALLAIKRTCRSASGVTSIEGEDEILSA